MGAYIYAHEGSKYQESVCNGQFVYHCVYMYIDNIMVPLAIRYQTHNSNGLGLYNGCSAELDVQLNSL